MAETRWLAEHELQAWRNLNLMYSQLSAHLARELAGSGLSYPDYVVLAMLSDQPEQRVRPSEMGCLLGWEKSRVSHHLSRMERRGLVSRERCPTDQRGWFIAMTEAGRAAIAAAAPEHVEAVRRHAIDLLTENEIATLDQICQKILDQLPRPE